EISPRAAGERERFLREYNFPIVTSSDAHYPDDIGRSATCFFIKETSIEELRKALKGKDGRGVTIE
ncbi:MAG: histidinol-phosphatase, partial [Thermoplasmata archaeon]|nr:histidinol-phosphatase [Thermoplasmata archaeon]